MNFWVYSLYIYTDSENYNKSLHIFCNPSFLPKQNTIYILEDTFNLSIAGNKAFTETEAET